MGCPNSKQAQREDKMEQEFITIVRKLSISFRQESSLKSGRITQIKQKLKLDLDKPSENRSKIKQEESLSDLTIQTHFKMMYDYLELQCKYIVDRQRYIPILLSKVANNRLTANDKLSILQPIEILLFSISIINDGKISAKNAELTNFQNLTRDKIKDANVPQTVEHNLLAYYKQNGIPNSEMIREVVFQFCEQANVSISKFQEKGHNFKY